MKKFRKVRKFDCSKIRKKFKIERYFIRLKDENSINKKCLNSGVKMSNDEKQFKHVKINCLKMKKLFKNQKTEE